LGIWLDEEKLNMEAFCEKSLENLKELIKRNYQLKGLKFKINCHSLIVDLPAKASVLNIKQFNGEFGCIACIHPGEFS
jgi:hypothetical protein